MDKFKLQKYETQLAFIWRLWVQFRRLAKLVLRTDPRHLKKIFVIANLYSSNKRFWATNDPKHLSRALASYFKLRNEWLKQSDGNSETNLEISGWSDKGSFLKIKSGLSGYKVRRVFRPDVWYLNGGSGGFFRGFVIDIPISKFRNLIDSLEMGIPGFEVKLPQDSIIKLTPGSVGRLESINPTQRQRGLDWYSTFHISPREFTWLVEAAADKEVAELALSFFTKFGDYTLDGETLRCIVKYCLILGFVPPEIKIEGWSLVPIKKPDWVKADLDNGPFFDIEESKVNAKYFRTDNVSVTNGGVIVDRDCFLDWDSAQHPALDFVAGNHNSVIGSSANMDMCFVKEVEIGETYESAILLGSRVDSNWFHFLIETLPRLFFVDEVLPKSIPVIVSSRIPDTAMEALRMVTGREVITVDAGVRTSVGHGYVPGPSIYHPDTQFIWNRADLIELNFKSLAKLRVIVLGTVKPSSSSKKTYWLRPGSHRVVTNERIVRKTLLGLGFLLNKPGDLSFKEQVKSIYESNHLVTSGGAAMSNFIFASEGASITVLVSKYGKTYPMPGFLASVSGAKLELIGGTSRFLSLSTSLVAKAHASFRINPRALASRISSN